MPESFKQKMTGKKHTKETKCKMSKSHAGKISPTKGVSWKLIDGKRIYSLGEKSC